MKAETDEELRKADAELQRNFLGEFTNPSKLQEQIEGLTKGFEHTPKLQKQMGFIEKMNQKTGSKRLEKKLRL